MPRGNAMDTKAGQDGKDNTQSGSDRKRRVSFGNIQAKARNLPFG